MTGIGLYWCMHGGCSGIRSIQSVYIEYTIVGQYTIVVK